MTDDVLQRLAATIHARRTEAASKSYTRELLDAGPAHCAKKLGEEATETVIAALSQDTRALTREAADLLYHLLVLLESRDVPLRRRAGRARVAHGHLGPCREGRAGKAAAMNELAKVLGCRA